MRSLIIFEVVVAGPCCCLPRPLFLRAYSDLLLTSSISKRFSSLMSERLGYLNGYLGCLAPFGPTVDSLLMIFGA
jgi:hypothetical protein